MGHKTQGMEPMQLLTLDPMVLMNGLLSEKRWLLQTDLAHEARGHKGIKIQALSEVSLCHYIHPSGAVLRHVLHPIGQRMLQCWLLGPPAIQQTG